MHGNSNIKLKYVSVAGAASVFREDLPSLLDSLDRGCILPKDGSRSGFRNVVF